MTLKEQFVKEHPEYVVKYNRHRIIDNNQYILWIEVKLLIALKDIEELKKNVSNLAGITL